MCLHGFTPDAHATISVSGAPAAPAKDDDEFETFGAPMGNETSAFGSASDPFASSAAKSDPFASAGRTSPAADDPFATPAGAGASDVDFGALLGSVGSPTDDPFASGGLGGDSFGGDGFGGDSLTSGADDGLFADDDPFADNSPPAEDDALFGDDDEDSLFLATANTSGAVFDDDDGELSHAAASSPMNRAIEEAAQAVERPRPSEGERPKRDLGPLIDRVLGVLLLILVAGIVLDYQGMPAFGLGDLLPSLGGGGEPTVTKRTKQQRPIPVNIAEPTDIKDTAATYQMEVERMKKVAEVRPDDAAVLAKLVAAYLDLMERYPAVFAADPSYGKELAELRKRHTPLRWDVLDRLTRGELLDIDPKIDALAQAKAATADDLGVAAWAIYRVHLAKTRQEAFDNPGRMSDPAIDPLLVAQPKDTRLLQGRKLATRALELAAKAPNRIKHVMIKARLDDMTGHHSENMDALSSFVPTAKAAREPRVLLIAGHIRSNHLGKAAGALKAMADEAKEADDNGSLGDAYRLEAWLAHKRGRVEDQIVAMQAALQLDPDDELTTVRLGRLLLGQKRSQECQKLLTGAKKRGMKSIAFEVALVEYWIWANRNDDALEEIKAATKDYPKSVDLLYLRGQVEEQQQHTATARDFYAKVIANEPQHLRAVLRLAGLQSKSGRHDDALGTLSAARKRMGDRDSILEPMAEELKVLRRMDEARVIYGLLLKKRPSHKGYLLNAARMDLKAGKIDSALKYLTVLRDEGALDKEGAKQMAIALASKNKPAEAAKTLVQFADRNPNDIRLNALSGQYMLDSGDIARAETLLKRASRIAQRQGGDAETMFQYGRLAFRKGDIINGISRMQQAIKASPEKHRYRFTLAQSLLLPENVKWPSAGKIAVRNLKHIITYADRFESNDNKVEYLAEVYRRLARYYFDTQRFALAIPLLQKSLAVDPKHLDTRVRLGKAMYQVNDPKAERVLREVLRLQPSNRKAALYLGLTLQTSGKISEAVKWLSHASKSKDPDVAEAWYQLALIYKERGQRGKAVSALRVFMKRVPKDHMHREDGRAMLAALGG